MAREVSKRRLKSRAKGGRTAASNPSKAADKRRKKRLEAAQSFPFMNRGGAREGAGRKAQLRADGKRMHHPHAAREKVTRHRPLHVTLNVVAGLPSLRGAELSVHVLAAIAGGNQREGFRIVHFSVMSNHVHLICEADDNEELARGMRGVGGRVAKKVNRLLGRKGRVIADRYHVHVLRTPTEVRNAVRYVLRNAERHDVLRGAFESADVDASSGGEGGSSRGEEGSSRAWWSGLDPLSSAVLFPWNEARAKAGARVPEVLIARLDAIVRGAQCALWRIAFAGAPLSLAEVLPARRGREANKGAGTGARAASRASAGANARGGLEA